MSLINKMLQDLDARGSQAGAGMQTSVKSVARRERNAALPLAGGAAVVLALLAAGGYAGWQYWKKATPAAAPVARKASPTVAVNKPIAAAAAQPAEAAAPPVVDEPPLAPQGPRITKALKASRERAMSAKESRVAQARPARVKAEPVRPAPVASAPASGLSESQKAESAYRRALASLQEGRVGEAMAGLELALQADARHEAARQTLAGLLIEAKRNDEAIKLLLAGLALESRQPSVAMLAARLQIGRGEPGIDTLQKTLPYALGNADYHAFLAGALQRAERHAEAAEQYEAALRVAPGNGVWWMGLGVSLQADKRPAEAITAYERARDTGKLSVPLLTFVERRLQALGR